MTTHKIEIKERLFRIILVVATVAVALAILQGLTLVNADSLMLIYCIMFAAFVFALILTFKYRYLELSSTILGVALIFVALPAIFLRGGGVNSGSGLWMRITIRSKNRSWSRGNARITMDGCVWKLLEDCQHSSETLAVSLRKKVIQRNQEVRKRC